jgi:hypothetical protein
LAAAEDPRTAFVAASVGAGSLERAQAILAQHPGLAAARALLAAGASARTGCGDWLRLFVARGAEAPGDGLLGLIAACTLGDAPAARALARNAARLAALCAEGGQRLGDFAGVGNTAGVRLLLELGVDVSLLLVRAGRRPRFAG